MKSFKESSQPANLAQQLARLDNETIANIFLSVLQTRRDSAILKGIEKTLKTRLDLIKGQEPDPEQEELF